MKKLLVVVDMQNDFITGSLGTPEAQAIVPAVVQKVQEALAAGVDVVFTLDTHGEDYLETQEGKRLPVVHCIKGTTGWQLESRLVGFTGRRFEKPTFGSMDLAHFAADGAYDEVELVGLCTDICVISNAMIIKAALPQSRVVVDSHCTAGVSPQSHERALEAMESCQIDVIR